MRTRLPFRITLIIWLVLINTVWNTVRLITSVAWRCELQAYAPYPGPVYVGLTGGLWAFVGLLIFWGLWRRSPRALPAVLSTSCVYTSWVWADRLFIQAGLSANWLFSLVATFLLLGFVAYVALDPRNQIHFGREAHEREFQERSSA